MRLKLLIAYVGTCYSGWQIQEKPSLPPTVQGEMEKALRTITGQNIRAHGSGRTDSGVHDVAQHVDARSIHRAVVGLADVGNASIVEDHIRTGYGAVDGFFIQNIACKHCLVGPQKWRGMQVNNGDRMPGFRKLVADMRAQKTGPAKDGNIHSYSPELGRSAARHKKTESMP